MSHKNMEGLREKLCMELDEVARKHEMGAGDLELAHKLTDTIKNIDKIFAYEDGGYSHTGHIQYHDGYSMRGRHRDSMGRYSRDGYGAEDVKDAVMAHLGRAMSATEDERDRQEIRRVMEKLDH